MFLTVVPPPVFPKIADSGLPEISSMAVMNISASTNTTAAVPAMAVHLNVRGLPARPDGPAGCIGKVVAPRRWVAGALGHGRDLQALGPLRRRRRRRHLDRVRSGTGRRRPGRPRRRGAPLALLVAGATELAQQRGGLGGPHDHLLDGLMAPLDRLRHERRGDGGGRRTDGHADDGALDPEGRRDDRRDHRAGGGGQDLTDRELHARTAASASPVPTLPCSLPHGAVDLLAQQVGVPVVTRVLLDHVDHDPAQGQGRLLGRRRQGVEARRGGGDRP